MLRRPLPSRLLVAALLVAALLVAALLVAVLPASARAQGTQRASAMLSLEAPNTVARPSLELRLDESLRATLFDDGDLRVDARLRGRASFRLLHGGQPEYVRLRDAAVTVGAANWQVRLGRGPVGPGASELVDGVLAVGRPVDGLEVGGWFGEVPEPWTSLPAPRVGGGPVVSFTRRHFAVSAVGQLIGDAGGLDRASLLVSGMGEPVERLSIAARLELDRSPRAPVHLADALVAATWRPVDALRLRLAWNSWSGRAWLRAELRDPALSRFAARYDPAFEGFVAGEIDKSVYHQVALRAQADPQLGAGRLLLSGDARYRHHDDVDRRLLRATVRGGARLLQERVELQLENTWTYREVLRDEIALVARLEPDKQRRLMLDGSLRLFLEPGDAGPRPMLYADLFVDARLPKGFALSVGYRFTDEPAIDRWEAVHAALFKVSWAARWKRKRARRSPAPAGSAASGDLEDGSSP